MHAAPLWRPTPTPGQHPPLRRDLDVDVAVIGGGITGLSLAHLLKLAGRRVVVLEMHEVGTGGTGSSTGHLTSVLDVDFPLLERRFGHHGAVEAASKSREAIFHIASMVERYAIPCGFERVDGWRYAESESGNTALEAEVSVARGLGIDAEYLAQGPLPFMRGAVRFRDQAKFDPVRYVAALAERVDGGGCHIFEGSRVEKVTPGDPCVLEVGGHTVRAREVVHASHTPIGVVLPLQLRTAAYSSYVLALRVAGEVPPDLYWDTADPYHYLRSTVDASGASLLLVGGEDHRSGGSSEGRFESLEAYARARFEVVELASRWSGEVFESVDGLPYVGRLGAEAHVYVATGFGGNGLTLGVAAALDLAALIQHQPQGVSVFRPQRYKPIASARRFLAENGRSVWRAVGDRLHPHAEVSLAEVPAGGGCLAELAGRPIAAYRTAAGRLHLLSPVCPHAGGVVRWNVAAATWDCPLHGSRFLPTGDVLAGPATGGLCPAESLVAGEERSIPDLLLDYEARGYRCVLVPSDDGARLRCTSCGHDWPAIEGRIEAVHRFEGASDPDDMCVVLALSAPRPDGTACTGVVVLGFGSTASPIDKALLSNLRFPADGRDAPLVGP